MRIFHFDMGDSTNGPIGMIAEVKAESPEEAVKLLQEMLNESVGDLIEVNLADSGGPVLYINIYINSDAIPAEDIRYEDECAAPKEQETETMKAEHDALVAVLTSDTCPKCEEQLQPKRIKEAAQILKDLRTGQEKQHPDPGRHNPPPACPYCNGQREWDKPGVAICHFCGRSTDDRVGG